MKSNFNSTLDNSPYSSPKCEKLEDYHLDKNIKVPKLISYLEPKTAKDLKCDFENPNKIKFAIENFLNTDEEIFQIKNRNFFFENYINPMIDDKDIPFNLKKTFTILTETSELELHDAEKYQYNYFQSTPTNLKNNVNHFKTPGIKSRYSLSNWLNSNSGGISTVNVKKSKSRVKNLYELSVMTEQSVCSKSTLRKAEEYLECLRNMEEKESCKEMELNNGTLNCYLITDQTVGESLQAFKKWTSSGEIQINKVECFDIIGDKLYSDNDFDKKFEKVEKKNCLNISNCISRTVPFEISTICYFLLALLIGLIFIIFIFHKNVSTSYDIKISCTNVITIPPMNVNWLIPLKNDKYEFVFHRSLEDLYN